MTGPGAPEVASPPAAPARGGVREARLQNGLAAVVHEAPWAPVVAMTLVIGVGSRHETAAASGVTALLGRVLLKGTRSRTALEVAQTAEDAGGAIETAADQEYSEIRVRGLARHWRTLLELLREVVAEPRVADEEVAREREALVSQIESLEDQPFQVASRLLGQALYGEHPYGLPPSGSTQSVGGLSRADLLRHRDLWHAPARMVLGVSGAVEAEAVLAEAARGLGALPPGPEPPPLEPPPGQPVRARVVAARAIQQAHLLMGFPAPAVGHPDHMPLRVATAVLGGGMSGRLFRILRDQEGLAYAVGALYPIRRESGRVVLHIGTAPGKAAVAEAGMRRELERLAREGVPEEELARAKAHLEGGFTLDLRTAARQSFYRAFFEAMGVGHARVEQYRALVAAVTGGDVGRVARRYLLAPATPAVAVVGPA